MAHVCTRPPASSVGRASLETAASAPEESLPVAAAAGCQFETTMTEMPWCLASPWELTDCGLKELWREGGPSHLLAISPSLHLYRQKQSINDLAFLLAHEKTK